MAEPKAAARARVFKNMVAILRLRVARVKKTFWSFLLANLLHLYHGSRAGEQAQLEPPSQRAIKIEKGASVFSCLKLDDPRLSGLRWTMYIPVMLSKKARRSKVRVDVGCRRGRNGTGNATKK